MSSFEEFNNKQPHEALNMKCPAEVYSASCRPYQKALRDTKLPASCEDRRGHQLRATLSVSQNQQDTCLAGHTFGVKEVDDAISLVSFMDYDLWLYPIWR